MPLFRYYFLYENGKIAAGEHIEVADLAAAIRLAYEDCRAHPKALRHIEVWSGTDWLYATLRKDESRGRVSEVSES